MILLIGFTLVLVAFVWFRSCLVAPHQRFRHIPGPDPQHTWSGNFDALANNKLMRQFEQWKVQYGNIFKFMYGRVPVVVVGDLDAVREILITKSDQFLNRPDPLIKFREDSGNLLFARDEPWRHMRRIVAPAFNSLHLNTSATFQTVNNCANVLNDIILEAKQEPICMHATLQKATMYIIGQLAFRAKFEVMHNDDNILSSASRTIFAESDIFTPAAKFVAMFPEFHAFFARMFKKIPPKPLQRVAKAFDNICKTIDQTSHTSVQEGQDFLDMINNAQDAAGNGLTQDQKQSISMTFLLAGHETTATTLAFAIDLLTRYPLAQEKVVEEVDRVLKGKQPSTAQEVKDLEYLEWVVQEALRLYCPAPFLSRETAQDCEILGKFIPARTSVWVPIWTIHRDKTIWGEDAAEFRPERHRTPPASAHAFIGFGAGPRACIGARFAMMEAKMILARLYQRFTFQPSVENVSKEIETVVCFVVAPANEVKVRAIPRTNA